MKRLTLVGVVLAACFGLGTSEVLAAGNPAVGKILAEPCMGCHGIPGYNTQYPTYHVPKLGGQHSAYIIAALKEYRAKTRGFKTMQAQAASLTDQDIEDIAAYLATIKRH